MKKKMRRIAEAPLFGVDAQIVPKSPRIHVLPNDADFLSNATFYDPTYPDTKTGWRRLCAHKNREIYALRKDLAAIQLFLSAEPPELRMREMSEALRQAGNRERELLNTVEFTKRTSDNRAEVLVANHLAEKKQLESSHREEKRRLKKQYEERLCFLRSQFVKAVRENRR